MSSSLTTTWSRLARQVNEALERYMPDEKTPPAELHAAMRYSVFAGGKRFRPVLCLLSTRLVGGRERAALPAACAIEMVHTYSLIHDDLPAMDDDDFRRGKPTLHRKFGEATAILAGDALLTLAFETISRRVKDASVAVRLCEELSRAAGHAGMAGGQVFDLQGEGKEPDARLVGEIHRRKTAALIRASARMGAIAGGATKAHLRDLSRFGENLGLLFQITDDLLDETGDAAAVGKRLHKDAARGKQTWPRIHGIEASREFAERLAAKCEAILRKYGPRAKLLRTVGRFLIERNN